MGKYRAIPGHDGPYLCTWTIVEWQPIFVRPQYARVILDSFRYCRERKGLAVHTFVIMATHLHLIASAVKPATIPDLMRDMKRHTSRQIHQLLLDNGRRRAIALLSGCADPGQDFSLWRAEYHPKLLADQEMFSQKARYVHENPVRAGFVDDPEAWVWSSARSYAGRADAIMDVDLLW